MKIKDKLIDASNKMINLGKDVLKFTFLLVVAAINRLPIYIKYKIIPDKFLKFIHNRRRIYWSTRTQRVYLKRGMKPMEFFEKLNQRKVEYVLLRGWEDLPDFPADEDINILLEDEHRDYINDLVSPHDIRGIKCDVYTVSGAKNGSRFGIPVFPYKLTQALLQTRFYFNGAYVPSPFPYFASVAYHAILHKGKDSGVPGFGIEPTKYTFNYNKVLKGMACELGIKIDLTVTGIFNWLKEEGFAPADDTLAKLVIHLPELSILEKRLFSDIRGGELMVFIIRERLLNDGFLNEFKAYLEDKYNFDLIDVRILTVKEKEICTTQIRGGKWDNGPFRYSGGPPVALVVAYDYHPKPLTIVEQKEQTRMTNRNNLLAKYGFRDQLCSTLPKGSYNGVHSADNETDAFFYISQVGESYLKKIDREVEIRRERYARKWIVKKLLSAGKICKVELINYGETIAVKKTFRPGKESIFERELFDLKELSPIPPLLEEGDGYIVVPYLENISDGLPEKEKSRQ